MRWGSADLFIAGTGVALGRPEPVAAAVADGRYRARDAARTEQLAVTIANAADAPLDLAVAAGRPALERSGHSPDEVAMLLHAVASHSGGLDAWNPAAYLVRELGLSRAHLAYEITSACAGALMGLELALPLLIARPDLAAALITAADVWPHPWIDRWQADSELPLADGAAAIVVSRDHGFARVLATATRLDASLEALGRGVEPLAPTERRRIDLHGRAHDFLRSSGLTKQEVWRRKEVLVRAVLAEAITDAGLRSPTDFDHVILGFSGRHVLDREWLNWLEIDLDKTSFEFGRRIGHLGPADPLATLNHLIETSQLRAGDRTLMVMEGLGLVRSAVVLESL